MKRRTFLQSVGGTIVTASLTQEAAAECTAPAPNTPDKEDTWEVSNERVCKSSNYNLYRRSFTNNALQQRVSKKTNGGVDRPVQSLIAIRLSPQGDMTPPSKKVQECSGSVGGTAFGFGLSLPCSWVKKIGGEDEVNPVSPEATRYLDTAFRDKINSLHGFSSRYDRQRHLRRSSLAGWKSLAYSKTGYDTFGFTYEPKWEDKDGDGFMNDLSFRAYLSVETDGSDYLGVGGVFPDESSQTISVEGNRAGRLQFDVKSMQQQTMRFMENTSIST